MKLKKGNSLLIYKTPKGYVFNRETGKRTSEAAYNLQFFEGRRTRREAVDKGLRLMQTKTNLKQPQIQRMTELFSETIREKQQEIKEDIERGKMYLPYYQIDKGNSKFKNENIKIITPAGGVIYSKFDNNNAFSAFEDLKSIMANVVESNKKKGGAYALSVAKLVDLSTGQITYDFSDIREFTDGKELQESGTNAESETISDDTASAILEQWYSR
tara:strand:+ start:924 stop:1568 length:645 start_codon:yes stop_codon:yes gene_type:complete